MTASIPSASASVVADGSTKFLRLPDGITPEAATNRNWMVVSSYDGTDYLILCEQDIDFRWKPVAIANLPVADLP